MEIGLSQQEFRVMEGLKKKKKKTNETKQKKKELWRVRVTEGKITVNV